VRLPHTIVCATGSAANVGLRALKGHGPICLNVLRFTPDDRCSILLKASPSMLGITNFVVDIPRSQLKNTRHQAIPPIK
jgi:hypothetical protein